jgi:hypothetical protein
MASTYINDLRLNEMATGDGSGTWGTTTNTNLELIAEAFSYGTEVITTNADTHTTTIADGATDPGRSLYLKYTGTLDSACTITIGPNTVSKVWIIENGTSGSQDIILSQGSGANITIPAGDTKVVYSDGAGAGAAFFDAFASLSVVDLKVQDDLTVTDDASIGGDATITGTLGVTGVFTGTSLDISGDIDVDGTTNLDVVDIDGAVDMASTLGVTGVATLASLVATTADINGGTIDGTVIGGTTAAAGTFTTFTSTGIDDNADATAITIDSSENVLVGKSSLGIGVDGTEIRAGGQLLVTADGDNPVDFNRKTSDGVIALFRKDGTTMGSIGTDTSRFKVKSNSLALYLENESNKTLIWGNVSSVPYFYPQSDNDTNIGYPTQRFKDIYLSGGVYLGGAVAANLLDDYEEGTWTPILSFAGGTTGISYGQQSGTYTKIGNIVCANFTIVLNSKGSSSGAAVVSALPYAVEFANHAFFIYSDRVTTTGGVVAGYISSGTSIAVYNQVSGGNSQLTNTAFANDSYISGVLTYRAA